MKNIALDSCLPGFDIIKNLSKEQLNQTCKSFLKKNEIDYPKHQKDVYKDVL